MIKENKKRVIIFDLDGTLAESKQPLDSEMAALLSHLIDSGYRIAVMSGGSLEQFKEQLLASLPFSSTQYKKLFLLPTSGASLYNYENGDWREIYKCEIPSDERKIITTTLNTIIEHLGLIPQHLYGELVEDRGTQITYSGLGQHAPIKEKQLWDPNQEKRKQVIALLSQKLPDLAVHIGGMTSIDVTQKGINKAYGVQKLSETLFVPIDKMAFVGDALFPEGNDAPVRASGIECISVVNIFETKQYIKNLLSVN